MSTSQPALRHQTGLPSFDATRRSVLPGVSLLRPFGGDFGVLRQNTAPGPDGWAASQLATPPNPVLVFVEAAFARPYEVRFGGRRMTLAAQPGSMMVLPAGLDREWRGRERRDSVIYVNMAPDWLASLAAEEEMAPGATALPLVTDHADDMTRTLLRLLRSQDGPTASQLFVEHWAVLAALHGLRGVQPPAEGRRKLAMTPARLARVREFVEANLGREIGLAELAGVAGLSRFHFARAFRAETGFSPHAYVTARRCERAKLLLAERCLTLAEVAGQCGFSHQAHFTTVFRRHVGTTPGRWREAGA